MSVTCPLYQTIAKGYFNDKITFGKGANASTMDSKDTYRWYDRLHAISFGAQWTQISVRDSEKRSKLIYVRSSQLATFLNMSLQQITQETSLELTKKFYEVKKLKGKISAIINTKHTLQHIMSFLNLQSLGRCSCVSTTWKKAAEDEPELWKSIIYKEIAFGDDKWAQCFGPDVIRDEPIGADLASLPWREVIKDFRNISNVFLRRKARDCLMLVRLPKTLNGGLSINSLGSLSRQHFHANANGYQCILDSIVQQLGNESISESYWVLMTKDILPESTGLSYLTQQQMVADLAQHSLGGYRVPSTLEAVTCILSQYFDSRVRLFRDNPWIYTRCLERSDIFQLYVGGFTPFVLFSGSHYGRTGAIGVAARRKFS